MTQDLFKADIHEATVVTLYLLQSINERLRPKLVRELKPGTRIVSHVFNMGPEWPAERTIEVGPQPRVSLDDSTTLIACDLRATIQVNTSRLLVIIPGSHEKSDDRVHVERHPGHGRQLLLATIAVASEGRPDQYQTAKPPVAQTSKPATAAPQMSDEELARVGEALVTKVCATGCHGMDEDRGDAPHTRRLDRPSRRDEDQGRDGHRHAVRNDQEVPAPLLWARRRQHRGT